MRQVTRKEGNGTTKDPLDEPVPQEKKSGLGDMLTKFTENISSET